MFRISDLDAEVWAKLMTDAAWYDKGLLLECKGEFRICSYAGLAVDSVMYCIICTTNAMMIFDIDMYVVCTRLMCMTYARIMYTHVYDVSLKILYNDHLDVSQTDDFNCEWHHFTTTFHYPVVKWLPTFPISCHYHACHASKTFGFCTLGAAEVAVAANFGVLELKFW